MDTPTPTAVPCEQVTLLLPWLANGTLGRDEARDVREHLIHCVACRGELRATRIALEITSEATSRSDLSAARPWKRLAVAAAIVASVVGGLVISRTGTIPRPAGQPTAVAADDAQIFVDGFESGNAERWNG